MSARTATRIYDSSQNGLGEKSKNDPRRRRRRRRRIIVGVAFVVVLLVAGAGTAFAYWMQQVSSSMSYDAEELSDLSEVLVDTEETEEADPFYVLILGSDARSGDTSSRSDTIILARVDPEEYVVTLISIPRDTMVYIDGYGLQKINAAYAYGGASLAVEVVSEFAGVDISHVVEVHFDEVIDVVDAVGGIEIDVQEAISVDGVTVEEGLQTLNGEQALAYARDRYHRSNGDFSRAEAQREVIEAVINKVLASSVSTLPTLVTELAESITTDYELSEILDLAYTFYGQEITFYSATCPSYAYNYNSVSYVATMYDEWQLMMQLCDAGLDPTDADAEVPEEQLANERLGAATNSGAPTDYAALAASSMNTNDLEDSDDDEEESEDETEEEEDAAADDE